jgi:hypothetical protein
MKVNIGPYVNRWTSQIHYGYMNKKYDYRWEKNTTKFEALLEKVEDVTQWIYNHSINLYLDNKEVNRKVKIHKYDTWSMDSTLAYIVHPMLIQLKATKHGGPFVDMEDRPGNLQCYKEPEDHSADKFHFEAWDWAMDEMIFAFGTKLEEDGEISFFGEWIEDESKPLGGRFEHVDWDEMKAHRARVTNGFRLFGKYYEGLWD